MYFLRRGSAWAVLGCLCANLTYLEKAWAVSVHLAEAPTNTLALSLKAIESAERSLQINIYEMTSDEIKNAIIERVQAGVSVQILEEGQPVGGFSAKAQSIRQEIVRAMEKWNADNRFYTMKGQSKSRRFRFDHGKYIVIDRKALLIGSENYSPTGHPVPGEVGNRGWETLIEDESIANQYAATFQDDIDVSHGDILVGEETQDASEWLEHRVGNLFASLRFVPFSEASINEEAPGVEAAHDKENREKTRPEPIQPPIQDQRVDLQTIDTTGIKKITSPDSSLAGLLALIRDAKSRIDLQLMTFDRCWAGCTNRSPLFDEIVQAARRGVAIRVLLNDERAFAASARQKNKETTDALNQIAKQEGLNLQGAVANLKAMGVRIIHNKGAIVDGYKTLISSINWNQNSVENNREAAVILLGQEIGSHYEKVFDRDWKVSQ